MSSGQDPIEQLRELQRLGREIDDILPGAIDDALKELGRPVLGRPPRTRDIPELEKALQQPGDPDARELIQKIHDNLRRQRKIIDELPKLP